MYVEIAAVSVFMRERLLAIARSLSVFYKRLLWLATQASPRLTELSEIISVFMFISETASESAYSVILML